MAQYRKLSVALLLYTTILWISQMTLNVTADGTAGVQETVSGTPRSDDSSTTSDLDRPKDHNNDTTSNTGESLGFYQRYKQFVAKHNKTFTIVFGVLFVISWVGGDWYLCSKGIDNKLYAGILIVFGMIIFVIVICKFSNQIGFTFFRKKKASVVNTTVDSTDQP